MASEEPYPKAQEVPDQVFGELQEQFERYTGGATIDRGAFARGREFIQVDVIENPKILWGGTHKQQLMRFAAYIGAIAAADARLTEKDVIDYDLVNGAIAFLVPSWEAICELPPKEGPGLHPRGDCKPTRELLGMPPAKDVLTRMEAKRLRMLKKAAATG